MLPRLSLLDFGFLEGTAPRDRLGQMVDLCAWAERAGFARYWVTEHHRDPNLAHSAPEVVAAAAAARTSRIRVGVAGFLLRLAQPYRVVQAAEALAGLFPGRIDVGLAGGGVGPESALAITGGALPGREAFEERARAVAAALRRGPGAPEAWVLGSGPASVPLAASLGASFCLGLFFGPSDSAAALRRFRDTAVRDPFSAAPPPRGSLAVAVACADTEGEARRVASRCRQAWLRPTLVGSGEQVAGGLAALSAAHGGCEVVVAPLGLTHEERLAGCEALLRPAQARTVSVP